METKKEKMVVALNDAKEIAKSKNYWGSDKDDPLVKRRYQLLVGKCLTARRKGMQYLGDGKYKVLKKEANV